MAEFIERRKRPRPNGNLVDGVSNMTPLERMAAQNKIIHDRFMTAQSMEPGEWQKHVERKFVENENRHADRNNLTREIVIRMDHLAEVIQKLAGTVDKLAVDVARNDRTTNSIAQALSTWNFWHHVWNKVTNGLMFSIKKWWPGYVFVAAVWGCWHGYPATDNDAPLGRQAPSVQVGRGK